jgi:hypothetical protein
MIRRIPDMLVFPNGWFRLAQGPTHQLGAPFLKLSGNGHKDLGLLGF